MALTAQSLAAAAKRKADVAKRHVQEAESELKEANATLQQAIPAANTKEIQEAHQRTMEAEKSVGVAAKELEVVTALLDTTEDAARRLLSNGQQ